MGGECAPVEGMFLCERLLESGGSGSEAKQDGGE